MNKSVEIKKYGSVDSTNRIALHEEEFKHLKTIVADTQTGGRGRMGRVFFSYSGGLYMSIMIDPSLINVPVHICTPGAAIAVKRVLDDLGISGTRIKWVNDILLEDKKVCGILTEATTVNSEINKIVVGIGINLSLPEGGFPEFIEKTAGAVGYNGSKTDVARMIAKELGILLQKDKKQIVEQYRKELSWLGKNVTVSDYSDGNKKIKGIVIGITDDCYLKIKTEDGFEKTISSGEITY